MLPLYEPVGLGDVEFFFVLAVLQILVAALLIADDESIEIRWQVSAQRFLVRSPN